MSFLFPRPRVSYEDLLESRESMLALKTQLALIAITNKYDRTGHCAVCVRAEALLPESSNENRQSSQLSWHGYRVPS